MKLNPCALYCGEDSPAVSLLLKVDAGVAAEGSCAIPAWRVPLTGAVAQRQCLIGGIVCGAVALQQWSMQRCLVHYGTPVGTLLVHHSGALVGNRSRQCQRLVAHHMWSIFNGLIAGQVTGTCLAESNKAGQQNKELLQGRKE